MGVFDVLSKVTGGGEAEEADTEADDATNEVDEAGDAIADPDGLEPADFREGAEMLSGRSDVPELDFTEESLVDLDSIATGNHPVNDPVVYGSYLGETLVREFDGEWVRDDGWAVEIYLGEDSTTVAVFDAARMALERGPVFEQVAEQLHAQGDPYAESEDDPAKAKAGSPDADPEPDGSDDSDDQPGNDSQVDAEDESAKDAEDTAPTPDDEPSADNVAVDPRDDPAPSGNASKDADASADDGDTEEEPDDADDPSVASDEDERDSIEPPAEPVEQTSTVDTEHEPEQTVGEPGSREPTESSAATTSVDTIPDTDDQAAGEEDGPDPVETTDAQAADVDVPPETDSSEEAGEHKEAGVDESDESPSTDPPADVAEESPADTTQDDQETTSTAVPTDIEPSTDDREPSDRPQSPDEPSAAPVDDPHSDSERESARDDHLDAESPDEQEAIESEDARIDSGDPHAADSRAAETVDEPTVAPEPADPPETNEPPEPTASGTTDEAPPVPTRSDYEAAAIAFTKNWSDRDFDYSPSSLVRLDRFLDDQWEGRFGPGSLDDSSTNPTESSSPLVNVGAYVGEILLRHYDGEWVRGEGGEPAVEVPGRHGRRETFPVFAATRRSLIHPARLSYEVDALAVRLDLDIRASGAEQTGFALGEGGPGTAASSADVITTILDRAETFAERWPTYDLDYRPASLSRLDNLVDRELDTEAFPDATLGDWTDPDALRLADTAAGIAAYYSAVLVRHLDAQWEIDEEVALAIDGPAGETREVPFVVAVARLRGRGKLMPSYDRVHDAVNVDARTSE